MNRRWLVAMLIGLPLLLVATLAALVKTAGSFTEYAFLKGAQTVLVEKAKYPLPARSPTIVVLRVFNIHRPLVDVAREMDAELKTKGWKTSSYGRSVQKAWFPTARTLPTRPGFVDTGYIVAMDGQAKLVPGSVRRAPIDRSHTVEGWTTVMIMGNYEPNWAQKLIDRFGEPPKNDLSLGEMQFTPSKAYNAFYAPPSKP